MFYYISHKRRVIFSHIPKCGCESIRHLLLSEDGKYTCNRDIWYEIQDNIIDYKKIDKYINKYTFITICRNPYYRLVSGYLNKIIGPSFFKLPFCKKVMNFYKRDMNDTRRVSFAEFVYYVVLQDGKTLDDHFKQQTLLFTNYKNNNIFKIEKINECNDFIKKLNFENKLINYNKVILNHKQVKIDVEEDVYTAYYDYFETLNGSIPKYELFYKNKTIQNLVYDYYKNDFEIFKYSYDI